MQLLVSTSGTFGAKSAIAAVFLVAFLTGQSAHAAATVSQKGDTLVINGTRGGDRVIIIGVDGHPGIVTVKVDDQPLVAHFGLTNINVNLNGGDNALALLQVHMAGNVTLSAGNGENLFILGFHETYMPNLIWGNLSVTAGDGSNEILLEESWIIGNTTLALGNGGNDIEVGQADTPSDLGAVLFGDLTIETGTGDEIIEIVKSWIGGQTFVDTYGGDDTVIFGTHYETGSEVAGNVLNDLVVLTGDDNDGVGLTDNEVYGEVSIELEDDNDELSIGTGGGFPPNNFYDHFEAHGGGGQDTLNNGPGNFYAEDPQFHSFQ